MAQRRSWIYSRLVQIGLCGLGPERARPSLPRHDAWTCRPALLAVREGAGVVDRRPTNVRDVKSVVTPIGASRIGTT
jgi:hypothetical protein